MSVLLPCLLGLTLAEYSQNKIQVDQMFTEGLPKTGTSVQLFRLMLIMAL